ncbi:MAG: HEAT repeat domain-containing protein [Candidatus Micrarchaeia archaeon]|jgi:hypothetical protein
MQTKTPIDLFHDHVIGVDQILSRNEKPLLSHMTRLDELEKQAFNEAKALIAEIPLGERRRASGNKVSDMLHNLPPHAVSQGVRLRILKYVDAVSSMSMLKKDYEQRFSNTGVKVTKYVFSKNKLEKGQTPEDYVQQLAQDPEFAGVLSDSMHKKKFSGAKTAKQAMALLQNPKFIVRMQAIRNLRDLEEPATIPLLSIAIHDEDADVRREAVDALGSLRHPAAISPLGVAAKDKDADVACAAVKALSQIPCADTKSHLLLAILHKNPGIRLEAQKALFEGKNAKAK